MLAAIPSLRPGVGDGIGTTRLPRPRLSSSPPLSGYPLAFRARAGSTRQPRHGGLEVSGATLNLCCSNLPAAIPGPIPLALPR